MIVDGDPVTGGHGPTLDELFCRVGVRHPHSLALVDPPNRESFTDGAPRHLTFAEADRAISELSTLLRGLGLATDTVVAIQLPNTVEAVIALLAVLRAGMIAAPLPLLWRERDIVAALGPIGAKAIITAGNINAHPYAETVMQAAVDLFPIRYVFAFGRELPDGVVPLDGAPEHFPDLAPQPPRLGPPSAHVAVVNFEVTTGGIVPIARSHSALIAGGLAASGKAGMAPDAPLLSTITPVSFSGIALSVVAWLLGGGTLHLHHSFDPATFAAQAREAADGTLLLPGPVLPPLAEAQLATATKNVVALWRAPERLSLTPAWRGAATVTDIASFGELGLVAMPRGAGGLPSPIPYGAVLAPGQAGNSGALIEIMRAETGTLAVLGRMLPHKTFPPGDEQGLPLRLAFNEAGMLDTGYPCRHEGEGLVVTGPPAGITGIGGYRFGTRTLEAAVAEIDAAATITAVPDALTGERLAASAADTTAIQTALRTRGANPLIAAAFRGRNPSQAA